MIDKTIRQKIHQIKHLTKQWITTGGDVDRILSQMKKFLTEAQRSGLAQAEPILNQLILQLSHPPTSDTQIQRPDQAA